MRRQTVEGGAEMVVPVEEYQKLQEDAKEKQGYFEQLLRLHAEFENFKKRSLKEKEQYFKFATEGLVYELINILEDFERAFDSANKMSDFKSLHQGVEIILKQVRKLLEKNAVKKIECVGELFDPTQQEAVAHIETDEYPENTVVEEVQKGYLLGDKLLRPAVVKVAKKVQKKEEKPETSVK